MTLKDYAQNYPEATHSFIDAPGCRSLLIQKVITLFKAARASSLEILQRLTDQHLSNSSHSVDHANQLLEAIGEKN